MVPLFRFRSLGYTERKRGDHYAYGHMFFINSPDNYDLNEDRIPFLNKSVEVDDNLYYVHMISTGSSIINKDEIIGLLVWPYDETPDELLSLGKIYQ
jgi:hypothetical protein